MAVDRDIHSHRDGDQKYIMAPYFLPHTYPIDCLMVSLQLRNVRSFEFEFYNRYENNFDSAVLLVMIHIGRSVRIQIALFER